MIPKIIHYCWFGNKPLPELAKKCIASWIKYLPTYEMKLWNEDNFDVNMLPYTKEAYEEKKYAFVTDYVRLYALYNFGGIYMDTDVEVIKPLDDLLNLKAFSGFEGDKFSSFPTGIMASRPKGNWVKEQMDYYTGIHFFKPDGTYDLTTNTQTISKRMVLNGFILNGNSQIYKNELVAFPKEYFCPKSSTGLVTLTKNTYCIHHFAGSWQNLSLLEKLKRFIYKNLIGPKWTNKIVNLKRKYLKNLF